MNTPISMTFFFGADNPLSNWHPAHFTVKGVEFCNNEQFMMFCKAKLFGDEECAQKILLAKNPREHKALGRIVRGFVDSLWEEKCEHFVYVGSLAKFRQNPLLCDFLLKTGNTELVEASPYDRIWGVGLSANDPRIHDKNAWLGKNRLGKVQMRVRAELALDHLSAPEMQSKMIVSTENIKHQFYDREDELRHCQVCNGAEGSLPTDCPVDKMSAEIEEAVYAGKIDFVSGAWRDK